MKLKEHLNNAFNRVRAIDPKEALDTAVKQSKEEMGIKAEKSKNRLWFFIQIAEFTALAIGGTIILWIYTPITFWWKFWITCFALLAFSDLYKNFLYVRWILINEEE